MGSRVRVPPRSPRQLDLSGSLLDRPPRNALAYKSAIRKCDGSDFRYSRSGRTWEDFHHANFSSKSSNGYPTVLSSPTACQPAVLDEDLLPQPELRVQQSRKPARVAAVDCIDHGA